MMHGELIWGNNFLKEMSEPHSDPRMRQLEEAIADMCFAPQVATQRDMLPAHYRGAK